MKKRTLVLAAIGALMLGVLAPAPAAEFDAPWTATYPVRQQTRMYLALFEGGTGYSLQAGGGSLSFLKTTDGAITWTPLPDPPGDGTPHMDFGSPQIGYIAASGDVFRTDDGGQTWTKMAPPTSDFVSWEAISATRGGRTLALTGTLWANSEDEPWRSGDCHDPRNDQMVSYVTHDGGKQWVRGIIFGRPSGTFHADFVGKRHGVVTLDKEYKYEKTNDCRFTATGSLGKKVMVTHDAGRSWDEALACPEPAGCMAVSITSAKHFATVTSDSRVLVTFDGGKTFETTWLDGLAEAPMREHIRWAQGISFGTAKVGYVSTNGRGIWRTVDGGHSWAREVSPHEIPGYAFGTVAASGQADAIAGGPHVLIKRLP